MKTSLLLFGLCAALRAQSPLSVAVEQEKGFLGDSFKLGNAGENWMIDSIRVWALPDTTPACSAGKPGDRIEKLTLYGALYNPPVPGQLECDCHALVPVVNAPMEKGGSKFANRTVTLAVEAGRWRIDFGDVRWSVPGGMDVLFAVRAAERPRQSCPAGKNWTLAAKPADAGYRLRFFDSTLMPAGFAAAMSPARQVSVQVKAHKN
ncbi:MAG TPA: hypothetical protein VNV86_06710 [Candidatus Acidoferrum sp.]|nr:hypothetical protein [Candidatus Acidoferrum sp.]